MKNVLRDLFNQQQFHDMQLHSILNDINFALWYLHEAEVSKSFDFDEFVTHLEPLKKGKIVNVDYLTEIWSNKRGITDIIHYFEMKKKRYVEFS